MVLAGWTPVPLSSDPNLAMPGSQSGSMQLPANSACTKCHGDYDPAVEPEHGMQGSMMAQATRDPLWLASVTVAAQDSIWALGNPNATDLCMRCHTPSGWLAGRSEPTNAAALDVSKGDFEGLSCAFCHRMLDPMNALEQPDVEAELPGSTAEADALVTKALDKVVLSNITLFDGSDFFDTSTDLPKHFGVDDLTKYLESGGGQFFVDPADNRRGPRAEGDPTHQFYYSRLHRSKSMCATCHDVSNPVLANVNLGPGASEERSAASYFHLERTFSEFQLSAYGQAGGARTNATMVAAGIGWARNCQDCHMPRVTGKLCNKNNVPTRTDAAFHDLTGGNAWTSRILASLDEESNPEFDQYNHDLLSDLLDVEGLQGVAPALLDGEQRSLGNLRRAGDIVLVSESDTEATVRIVNNTGHKLISGFPEGRRMWLNVRFVDASGVVPAGLAGAEVNPYEELVITGSGPTQAYVSGGDLVTTRDDLVYEAHMSSSLTGEDKSFHMVLATDRYKDNRIPPKGFDLAGAASRLSQPRWEGADAPDYFTVEEYAGGYDEVTFPKPPGAAGWVATLYYQTTSKEYVEFLRDEINGTGGTLASPTPSGEADAYIVQSTVEPSATFFSPLKTWGDVIWNMWLHNDGAPPVFMAAAISRPTNMELSRAADGIHIVFDTIVGREYRVEVSADLTPASWGTVGGVIGGDGSAADVVDPAGLGQARRFYRVVSTQAVSP